jgi:hypothetical protein
MHFAAIGQWRHHLFAYYTASRHAKAFDTYAPVSRCKEKRAVLYVWNHAHNTYLDSMTRSARH